MSCIAKTFNEALYKAFQGAGIKLPKYKNMVMTVRDSDKEEMLDIAARFKDRDTASSVPQEPRSTSMSTA